MTWYASINRLYCARTRYTQMAQFLHIQTFLLTSSGPSTSCVSSLPLPSDASSAVYVLTWCSFRGDSFNLSLCLARLNTSACKVPAVALESNFSKQLLRFCIADRTRPLPLNSGKFFGSRQAKSGQSFHLQQSAGEYSPSQCPLLHYKL